ncbi:MAG: redoxin family protein [Gammaproteobacteria bacterium]|jgi:thiol-disulfide isomerase/thioredoxin|nr:redoxin family protein [Gammaproteobacteria bacterium]
MSNLAATLRHPASALLLIATLGLLACGEPPAPPGPRVGETFPALDLPALDGPPLNLGDYRGRVLVLNVWATWCAPCREEMPSLQRLSERFPSGRFAVVGLTVDEDTNLAREFLLKYGIRFPSASDPAGAVAEGLLGVTAYPDTFIVAADGTLVERVSGGREWDGEEMVSLLERLLAAGT